LIPGRGGEGAESITHKIALETTAGCFRILIVVEFEYDLVGECEIRFVERHSGAEIAASYDGSQRGVEVQP
jgi:hypothetical protein